MAIGGKINKNNFWRREALPCKVYSKEEVKAARR